MTTSSGVNVLALRERELETGIRVRDEQSSQELGLSKVAAQQAMKFVLAGKEKPFQLEDYTKEFDLLPQ